MSDKLPAVTPRELIRVLERKGWQLDRIDFVVDAAVIEAERVLADRTQFTLDTERWNRFVELLDRPPQDKPGLEKLFSTPSVLGP